jgi:hypothetical protein
MSEGLYSGWWPGLGDIMMGPVARTLSLSTAVLLGSCSSSAGGVSWGGIEPHISVHGTLGDEEIDIELSGAAATGISCERQYETMGQAADPTMADLNTAVFSEVTIDVVVTIDGEERLLELELKKHDLQSDMDGDVVHIVPRSTTEDPAADSMWVEMEWHTIVGDVTYFEEAAQSGTVTREAFTGTPGPGGVVIPEGDGVVGVTIDARWSPTERLTFSITAPCLYNDVNVN